MVEGEAGQGLQVLGVPQKSELSRFYTLIHKFLINLDKFTPILSHKRIRFILLLFYQLLIFPLVGLPLTVLALLLRNLVGPSLVVQLILIFLLDLWGDQVLEQFFSNIFIHQVPSLFIIFIEVTRREIYGLPVSYVLLL